MPKGVYPRRKFPQWKSQPCAICGKELIPTGPFQKYCLDCKVKLKKQWQVESTRRYRERGGGYDVCPDCGKRKQITSALCLRCNHKKQVGNAHPGWKGGRRYRGHYIQIWTPQGYVWEHHLVWEQTHNKKLSKNYIVHHLNGISDDNRPGNLVAVLRYNHEYQTLLKLAQKRIRELEQLHLPI